MHTSLEELDRLAAGAQTTGGLARGLLAALQGISGLDSILLSRVDIPGDRIELTHAHNAASARHPIPEGLGAPWSESVCSHALAAGTHQTHTARDRWPELDVVDELNITTYAMEPIRDDAGAVIGTLCAISDRRRPVTARTRQAMQRVAQLMAPWLGGSAAATADGARAVHTALATHDSATGLASRATLAAEMQAALGAGQHLCLAMVELVALDAIDHREGHWAADQFLYTVSQRLVGVTATEPGAFIARTGDGEFAVMLRLPTPTPVAAGVNDQLVDALRERLAAATRGQYEVAWTRLDHDGAVVTTVCAEAGEDAPALLWRAEETMREAGHGAAARPPGSAADAGP